MASIRMEGIVKDYGALRAVQGIDLEIPDGEFVAFVGPSGCGKSTLLRMVAGLEEISSGTLHIGEHLMNDVEPRDRDVAMVFQDYALYPHMTIAQNIGFGLKMRRVKPAEIANRSSGRPRSCRSATCWNASPLSFRAGSASGWPWGGPSCATHRCSCSMSHSAISTPSCGSPCAPRSSGCTRCYTPPPST